MKKIFLSLILIPAFVAGAGAVNIQDWIKKSGTYQKKRKYNSRQTNVAAVRGVEEPGDVDPEARNFDALAKIESRRVPKEKVLNFIDEGGLKKK